MPWGLSGTNDRLITRANFLGSGTVPVESFESGMSPYSCHNMAGNVAEWCLNRQGSGFTLIGVESRYAAVILMGAGFIT